MLSHDDALGSTLQTKWTMLRRRLAVVPTDNGSSPLRLVFSMPAMWSDELAQLFVSAGRAHPHFLIVLQMESDVECIQRLRALGLHVSNRQVKVFVSVKEWVNTLKHYDLAIGARIHGGLAATAASVPAVVVATDMRIDELAKRVGIPTVRAFGLRQNLSLANFLRNVHFDGAVFDQNRAMIARKYVHAFSALGVPIGSYVERIAHAKAR